ncbi:MAG TPA: CDP-4-keto-6-deoxy-D-glucose-3-dehydrase [Actinobacteria bacterium]|nr:CDP-4-keto-6-deoxy-D-glucose-3-dehydrase [Actinomycetota bacterium]
MWQLASDTIGEADLGALADFLRTNPKLTQGDVVRQFEQAWSEWLGVKHSVMVSSGTTANFALVATAAARVARPRPRVGASTVTWSTNISPSILMGHQVTLFDIDRRTLGIDADHAVAAMDAGEIDILFLTHLLGFDGLSDRMLEAAERNRVILLEDCCESHGARHGGARVGTYGLGSTFSFYFGHHMSTIEGGMVSTNDADLADDVRLMRAHGLARESTRFAYWQRLHPDIDDRFLFVSAGLNFRSTELNALLGLRQLEGLDDRIAHRNANMRAFLDHLPAGLWTDFQTEGMSNFALPLIADNAAVCATVKRVLNHLDIESRPVVAGNLLHQPFVKQYGVNSRPEATPVADHVHRHGFYVGNGHHVTIEMIDRAVAYLARELAGEDRERAM